MHLVTFERRPRPRASATRRAALEETHGDHEEIETAPQAGRRIGALLEPQRRNGPVLDLNRALALRLAADDAGAPEAEADSLLPSDPLAFLRALPDSLEAARDALAFLREADGRFDHFDAEGLGAVEPGSALRLHAPVPRPGKVIGVARNYVAHAAERGAEAPEEPVLFIKASSTVIGPGDAIRLPPASRRVDFEGELAVVIGRRAHRVDASRALERVAGYCIANDVTARDYQNERGQHFIGKSFDSFAPLGPALVTADEIGDPQDLALRTLVSGETMQDARTKEMIFPVAELIAFASRLMTLEPGDVLLTGTPAGVGAAREPARYLRDGDVVEITISGLGTLRNPVRNDP